MAIDENKNELHVDVEEKGEVEQRHSQGERLPDNQCGIHDGYSGGGYRRRERKRKEGKWKLERRRKKGPRSLETAVLFSVFSS